MFKLLVCLSILGLALAAPTDNRIVGGAPVDISKVPYQVAVGNDHSIWCGGSIIDRRWILTAAHCFNDHDIHNEQFNVYVGMNKLSAIDYSMLKDVRRVNVHPEYNRKTHNKDIALMELVEDLEFNRNVGKVDLPYANEAVPYGAFAYATGWGLLKQNGSRPDQLQGVNLELLTAKTCSRYGYFDATYMQCAGSTAGTVDTCQGDSGGPLVYNGIQYGVVSFGRGCASPGFPGVYAHVPNLRDYINSVSGL